MKKYTVIGINDNELLQGQLSRIMDAIRDKNRESSIAIRKGQTDIKSKQWAQIYFENNLVHEFYNKFPNESDVLYINKVAMNVLDIKGIKMRILNETDEIPSDAGVVISLPIYMN